MHGYLNGHYLQMQSAVRRAAPAPPPPRLEASVHYLPRDVSSRFGLRLRELRRERNMTQLRMAVDFGIDRSYISEVERGRKSVSLPTLEIFALGLKLSLSDLLDGI
jgi:DNA-binding XRE family transcriptional regulator